MSIRKKLIGTKDFYKLVLSVAVPIMIQNGITNFVGLLDNIMVGQVGTEQMSGVAVANQLLFVFNICVFGAISGAGIFGAQFYGCGNYEGVRNAFRFKLWFCAALVVIGIAVFIGGGESLISLYLHGGFGSGGMWGEPFPSATVICCGCCWDLFPMRSLRLTPVL